MNIPKRKLGVKGIPKPKQLALSQGFCYKDWGILALLATPLLVFAEDS
jgi:hypothetical protein